MKLFEKDGKKIFDEIFKDMLLSEFFSLNDTPKDVDIDNMRRLTELLLPIRNLNLPPSTTILEALTVAEIISNPDKYKKDYPELFIDRSQKNENREMSKNQDDQENIEKLNQISILKFKEYIAEDSQTNSNLELKNAESLPKNSLEEDLQDIQNLKKLINQDIEAGELLRQNINKG